MTNIITKYKKGKQTVEIQKPRKPSKYFHIGVKGETKDGSYEGFGIPYTSEVFEELEEFKQMSLL